LKNDFVLTAGTTMRGDDGGVTTSLAMMLPPLPAPASVLSNTMIGGGGSTYIDVAAPPAEGTMVTTTL
jgi:hypothetical protein